MGEAASAPLETLDVERKKLREITKDYDLNDVFNCDEIGEYWIFQILYALICEYFFFFVILGIY